MERFSYFYPYGTTLSQRVVQLIWLAVLRNLGKIVVNVTQKMAITNDIKEDAFYQLAQEEGLQKGRAKGKEEGKEAAALHMLKEGFSPEVVASITKLSAERIAQLQAGKKG
jgi:predicted transposase/invertase (TIGR01784 family)